MIELSGHKLLADSQDVSTLVLPAQVEVPFELSFSDPNSVAACQKWIQNRASKFGKASSARIDRHPKTIEEQVTDLYHSSLVLRDFQQQIKGGKHYLLGHLASALRSSVYWPKGSDDKPPVQYDPLLLRMANLAALPLPVYSVPKTAKRLKVLDEADRRYEPSRAPRIERAYPTDEVCDLQESLASTVLRLGQFPGATITAIELIAVLANTTGGAHYDKDASDFVKVLNNISTEDGTQLLTFMCHTAETVAVLSEWVLSELKTRNVIA